MPSVMSYHAEPRPLKVSSVTDLPHDLFVGAAFDCTYLYKDHGIAITHQDKGHWERYHTEEQKVVPE